MNSFGLIIVNVEKEIVNLNGSDEIMSEAGLVGARDRIRGEGHG